MVLPLPSAPNQEICILAGGVDHQLFSFSPTLSWRGYIPHEYGQEIGLSFSIQPLLIGQRLYSRFSSLSILGSSSPSPQLVYREEVPCRKKEARRWEATAPPSTWIIAKKFCLWQEAFHKKQELWCSPQKNWLYVEQCGGGPLGGGFKSKRILENNGDFDGKQIRRDW